MTKIDILASLAGGVPATLILYFFGDNPGVSWITPPVAYAGGVIAGLAAARMSREWAD